MTLIHDTTYMNSPWNVPVPVRRSQFTPMTPELARYNVEVDYAHMKNYGALRTAVPDSDLLFADLQTNSDMHIPGRLGSGRAGAYRGRYLKGVGRTPLAQNWNVLKDQKVGTGHLTVTAAIREYISSCFFRAKRQAHLINDCEGLLIGPLRESLRDFRSYGHTDESRIAPCDRTMQAISVKGTRYARFSNFAWLMNHLDLHGSSADVRNFFVRFIRYLDPKTDYAMSDITPENVVVGLDAAIERGLANFRGFWRLGVFWGAPYNNFTMDGRYHDLDTALFLGGPVIGVLPQAPMTELKLPEYNAAKIFGLEVLSYAHYVRIFYRLLLARLSSLLQMEVVYTQQNRDFLRATVQLLRARFTPQHVLLSHRKLVDRIVGWVEEDCKIAGKDLKSVRRMIEIAAQRRVDMTMPKRKVALPLRTLGVDTARPGTFREYQPPMVLPCCEVPEQALAEARFMNQLIADLDHTADRDELLTKLLAAPGMIERTCGVAEPLPVAVSA